MKVGKIRIMPRQPYQGKYLGADPQGTCPQFTMKRGK